MVGDFDSNILPLFYHYVEQIRIHILLFDKRYADTRQAKQITKGLESFIKHTDNSPLLLQMSFDEDSVESIDDVYEIIKTKALKDEAIYLNASDGLASTLAVIQPQLQKDNGSILAYDRFENTCNILNNRQMRQEYITPMNITEHLILKNVDYEIVQEDEAMRQRKKTVFKLLNNTNHYMEYKKVINTITPKHPQYWMKTELDKISSDVDKNYAYGTIFEEYCYWLVKDLGFDDVQLGVKITHNPQTNNDFENELDVLVMKDNHLHVIECKLRNFVDGEHFIYKYDSVGKLLDADGRRMIVSIGGNNIKVSKSGKRLYQFNKSNLKRARQMDIYIYQEEKMDTKRFVKEVKHFFL